MNQTGVPNVPEEYFTGEMTYDGERVYWNVASAEDGTPHYWWKSRDGFDRVVSLRSRSLAR